MYLCKYVEYEKSNSTECERKEKTRVAKYKNKLVGDLNANDWKDVGWQIKKIEEYISDHSCDDITELTEYIVNENILSEDDVEDRLPVVLEKPELLDTLMKVSLDNELFDFNKAINDYGILNLLSPQEEGFMTDWILENNIRKMNMFPELKKQYPEYLNNLRRLAGLNEENTEEKNYSAPANIQYPFVIDVNKTEVVIDKIIFYQKGKSTPKDLAMPVRAAIDAGAIRRPTFGEYDSVKGFAKVPKTSLAKYTNPDTKPYIDKAFNAVVEDFENI